MMSLTSSRHPQTLGRLPFLSQLRTLVLAKDFRIQLAGGECGTALTLGSSHPDDLRCGYICLCVLSA